MSQFIAMSKYSHCKCHMCWDPSELSLTLSPISTVDSFCRTLRAQSLHKKSFLNPHFPTFLLGNGPHSSCLINWNISETLYLLPLHCFLTLIPRREGGVEQLACLTLQRCFCNYERKGRWPRQTYKPPQL